MDPVISARGVVLERRGRRVLDRVELNIGAGEIVGLLGPSGSGKTTLMKAILGLLPLSDGEVRISGRIATSRRAILIPPEARNLAVVFQDLALWPHMSVLNNLLFCLEAKGIKRGEAEKVALDMLERVGLGETAHRRPGELSGGERQRVAIARALVLRPQAVLLDEPLSDLDLGIKDDLLELFAELFAESASTVMYVCHDPMEAKRMCSRLAILEQGRITFPGGFDALATHHPSRFVSLVARAIASGSASVSPDRN